MIDFDQYHRSSILKSRFRIAAAVYVILCFSIALACHICSYFQLYYTISSTLCNVLFYQSFLITAVVCFWFNRKYHTRVIWSYTPFIDIVFILIFFFTAFHAVTGVNGTPREIGGRYYLISRNNYLPIPYLLYCEYIFKEIRTHTAIGMLLYWSSFMLLVKRKANHSKYARLYRIFGNVRFGRSHY